MSGRNSVVECYLAKVDVDGSNPFARSSQQRRHSQGAKAAVCKTVIHRFESGCRLQIMDLGAARSIVQPLSLLDAAERHLTADSQQPAANKSLLDTFSFFAVGCRL